MIAEARTLHWVSFATEERNLGVCFVLARDVLDAASECWRLGINPGGEFMAVPVPTTGSPEASAVREKCLANMNRLIQSDELRAMFDDLTTLREISEGDPN